ncbi:MAG: NAD(P)-dependent alcohol dehydrogenase [Ignavibacteriae bacterium]|nr:NAD(P)-dependent alcohol dehydrogenase [Ignavibacteriota bacterium]NOG99585.1 NAD(P)-dependent alcohol dehydrogenase [Ignavibacteriota bacterium]
MKAIYRENYGTEEELKLTEVENPEVKENEVLVKVIAASINASDVEFLTGSPFYTRMWGLFKPKIKVLGSDIAGYVESTGSNAVKFKPGDKVFGDIFDTWGGLAEYVSVNESKLLVKPDFISFEEAAAIPQASLVALQGLTAKINLQPGQKVLINGAGGGAGSFAIQIAKTFGTEVTGVDSAAKLDMIKDLGADNVIDYTNTDFTKIGERYDLILDLVAGHPIRNYKRTLADDGTYLFVGGSLLQLLKTVIVSALMLVANKFMISKKKIGILTHKPNKGMEYILSMIESKKMKCVIDKVYKLNDIAEAMRHLMNGNAKGKIVININ